LIPISSLSAQRETVIKQEIHVHRMLRARRCVMFRAAYTKPPEIIILTEYCESGNLYDLIQKGNLRDEQRFKYSIQVCEGLIEIHTQTPPIVHRDLKPTNVLLDEAGNVKICDFGFSHIQQSSMSASTLMAVTARQTAGTDVYKAPEAWDPEAGPGIDEKSDIYSFGILMHELFQGSYPWADKTREMLLTLHVLQKRSPPCDPALKQKFPKVAAVFEQCCRHDPLQRPTAVSILRMLKAVDPAAASV